MWSRRVSVWDCWRHRGSYIHTPPPLSPNTRNQTQENKEAPLPQLLCMGGEWYRFPSSFFLPHHNMHLAFVRSHFKAQLPQPFRPENGTWAPPLQVCGRNRVCCVELRAWRSGD